MTERTLANVPIEEEVRELAFGLWCGQGGRSPARTSQLLEEAGYKVKPNTIGQWAHRDGWHLKASEMLASVAPGMVRETAINLMHASLVGSRWLVEAAHHLEET